MKIEPLRISLVIILLCSMQSIAKVRVYTQPHDILVAAIRHGSASGLLEGEVDAHFTRQFRSTGPLWVTAKVIQTLGRDCKRLEVVFTKKEVETPQGRTEAILKTQLNYCLDGAPPRN